MISSILNSITIQEPRVMLSDIILAAACFYCYFKISSKTKKIIQDKFSKYWRRFFLFEGISFLIGGLAHGFYEYFGDVLHFVGWYASIIGVFYFTWGMMKASWNNINKKLAYMLIIVIILSIVSSTIFRSFGIIVVYCFLSMFIVIFINAQSKIIALKNKYSKGILIGTALFIFAALIHILRINLFGFPSQVISHIVIAIGILFFGNGCLKTIFTLSKSSERISEEIIGKS